MNRLRRRALWLAPALAVIFATTSCGSDEPTGNGGGGGGGGGDEGPLSASGLEDRLSRSFEAAALGMLDGFDRLLTAINGGAADGVTITPTGPNSFSAEIQVDLDGNGNREGRVYGGASGDIQTGATISVTSVTTPLKPTLVAGGSVQATETSPGTIVLDQVGGGVSNGEGNETVSVSAFDGSVSLNLATGNPNGFVESVITGTDENGEFVEIFVTTTFESDGAGGWRARFSGEGFEFTVP